MQLQTLKSDALLSASWYRAVLHIHVSIFEQVGSQLQKLLFNKVSLGATPGITCAFITKNPAAPASVACLNVP